MAQCRVNRDRAKVCVCTQQLAQRQQSRLWPPVPGCVRQRRAPDGTEQNGFCLQHAGPRTLRQRGAIFQHAGGAYAVVFRPKAVPVEIAHCVQHTNSLGRDLGTDAVTREHRDRVIGHEVSWAARRRSKAAISGSSSNVRPISSRPCSSICLRYSSI